MIIKKFNKYPDPLRNNQLILDLLNLILNNNVFSFKDTYYQQISGLAMGVSCAPSAANLYLQHLDEKILELNPILYKRYIDDILLIADIDTINNIQSITNNIIDRIVLEYNINTAQLNFLDITLFKDNNQIHTKPYIKPTNSLSRLHRNSDHPQHIFMSILKSAFIRYKQLSSNIDDYINTATILTNKLEVITQLR